jgi:hypothetical protein
MKIGTLVPVPIIWSPLSFSGLASESSVSCHAINCNNVYLVYSALPTMAKGAD